MPHPVLPPIAWNLYCSQHADKIGAKGLSPPLEWSTALSQKLALVNNNVNLGIVFRTGTSLADTWDIWPSTGCCNDYAVTKRAELMKSGFPDLCLLLAEAVIEGGEHHLVLLVRTSRDTIVLDNRTPALLAIQDCPYRFLRMQTPDDPTIWSAPD